MAGFCDIFFPCSRNKESLRRDELDLHGLHAKEAAVIVDIYIHKFQKRKKSQMKIICGKGLHSEGDAVLKPSIIEVCPSFVRVYLFLLYSDIPSSCCKLNPFASKRTIEALLLCNSDKFLPSHVYIIPSQNNSWIDSTRPIIPFGSSPMVCDNEGSKLMTDDGAKKKKLVGKIFFISPSL